MEIMINPTEFHEKLLNYPATTLLPKERQLALITEIVKDCKEYLIM